MQSLDIDYYKSGYTVDHISCIEVSVAGATGFYDYHNYFYYSFYYSFFENWTKFKGDQFLALRNRALNKIGLILKPNKVPGEKIWDVCGMKFSFPDVYGDDDDNIVCKNQTIPINTGDYLRKYKKIMILGFSEYGSYIEPLEIKFIDGRLEKVTIGLSISRGPIYGETVAWKGKAVKRNVNSITIADYEPHIFANTYYLKTDGIIESMRLPGCSNIHILAISLG